MTLRLCQSDFEPTYIQAVIESIGDTLAKEDEAQTYFRRSFCIMELAATPDYCLEFPVCEARRWQILGFSCLKIRITNLGQTGDQYYFVAEQPCDVWQGDTISFFGKRDDRPIRSSRPYDVRERNEEDGATR